MKLNYCEEMSRKQNMLKANIRLQMQKKNYMNLKIYKYVGNADVIKTRVYALCNHKQKTNKQIKTYWTQQSCRIEISEVHYIS